VIGLVLLIAGAAVLAAEALLLATGAFIAVPLMVLTIATLFVVASEVWADWR